MRNGHFVIGKVWRYPAVDGEPELWQYIEPPTAEYFRNRGQWRRPMVHLMKLTIDVETIGSATWLRRDDGVHHAWCGSVCSQSKAVTSNEVPEGFEVCQRCAEAKEFHAHRTRQQEDPDRAAYNERTSRLLEGAA